MAIEMRLNYSGMMDDVIGEHGIAGSDLKSLMNQLDRARNEILSRFSRGDLEWLGLPLSDEYVKACEKIWNPLKKQMKNLVILGIGGSALGNIALQTALCPPFWNQLPDKTRKGARLYVLDNVDPEKLEMLFSVINVKETLFNVITKSGSTAETAAQLLCVVPRLKKAVGDKWKDHIVITTDPEKGAMRKLADSQGISTLVVPPGVGGRFSVLCPVGLLSVIATGADACGLLEGARNMHEHFRKAAPECNVPLLLAGLLYLAYTTKGAHIHVMMPYSDHMRDMADWFRQLWAESLGKAVDRNGRKVNTGPTPEKALGTTDQHSQVQLYMEGPFDKVVMFIEVDKESSDLKIASKVLDTTAFTYLEGRRMAELFHAELIGTKVALTNAGRLNLTIRLPEVNSLAVGEFIYAWELATAVAGELWNIDAFDQPGVEAGKVAAYALMGKEDFKDARSRIAELEQKLEGFTAP
jgi:glucose-6-phosphate isomerase